MRALCLIVTATFVACSTSNEFVFRNDDRPQYARNVDPAQLAALKREEQVVLLDVRLLEDYQADPTLIPGANYKDPDNIAQWHSSLPRDATVVVYCVKGKWVSQKAAHFLERQGYDTYSLTGGIEGWRAAQE